MIRTALLSFWHVHAAGYAQQASDNPDIDLVAVWDEDAVRGRREAERLGLVFIESLDDLLTRDDIDAVVVETPTSLHHEVILKAAAANKHVFVDKVLAPTIKQANEIVAAVQDSGCVLFVGLSYLYHNFILTLKGIIESGELGKIVSARLMNGHGMAVEDTLPAGFYSLSESNGGALIDMCHVVYVLPYLLGMPTSALSTFADITGREVEDSAAVMYEYADSGRAMIEASFATRGAPNVVLEFHGTEGSAMFRADSHPNLAGAPLEAVLEKRLGGEKIFTRVPFGPNAASSMSQWTEHILKGTVATENTKYALDLSRLIEAAYMSAERGGRVAMDSLDE